MTEKINVRMEKAARMVGLGLTTFTEFCDSGEIRTFKVGRARLVPVSELRRWSEAQLEAQPPDVCDEVAP